MKTRVPTLVVVGQTPPPYNGQAVMIREMIQGLDSIVTIHHVRMAYSDSVTSAGRFFPSKIGHLFVLVTKVIRLLRAHPGATLYYPPASPNYVPIWRDMIFLYLVRRFAGSTVFHFHAGGLSFFLARHPLLRCLAGSAYRQPELAIEGGASCPRDGRYFDARHVRIVPNGYDVPIRAVVKSPSMQTLRILFVGIHAETKGVFDLVQVAIELKRRDVSFEIHMVGQWYSERERLACLQLIEENDLAKQVVMHGLLCGDDLWEQYALADVFLFPTHYPWETQGLVLIEAMAYGLPIVATRWQGPLDVVIPRVTGFLHPVHDIQGFVQSLEVLHTQPEVRLRMGRAARQRYEEEYTAARFTERMREALATVMRIN